MKEDKLQYPIGKFKKNAVYTPEMTGQNIRIIETFPERLKKEIAHFDDEQLDTPYRPGGWTVRQVVNHCADSHMNSFLRCKLALTEDLPVIKPYLQDAWARLADSRNIPVQPALSLLEGLHERWAVLLRSLTEAALKRRFVHPGEGQEFSLHETISLYAWHCDHHLAHITTLKQIKNWQ